MSPLPCLRRRRRSSRCRHCRFHRRHRERAIRVGDPRRSIWGDAADLGLHTVPPVTCLKKISIGVVSVQMRTFVFTALVNGWGHPKQGCLKKCSLHQVEDISAVAYKEAIEHDISSHKDQWLLNFRARHLSAGTSCTASRYVAN